MQVSSNCSIQSPHHAAQELITEHSVTPEQEDRMGGMSEGTPLLVASTSSPLDEESATRRLVLLQEGSSFKEQIPLFRSEFNGMVSLALPVIGTYILEMFPGLVSIILVGQVNNSTESTKDCLDATALSVMFMNLFGMSIGFGLATAMDTLCSQAYGARETHRMGVYLQTGMIVLASFGVLVAILFYNCESILLALGQPPIVSELAGTFAIYLLPGVPFLFLYELLRKILQAQNVARPMLLVSIVANLVNAGLGYHLVYHSSWGWLGAAVARTACNMTFLLLLLPYTIYSGLSKTFWTGLRLQDAINGIPQFLSLGIPGMLQLCFEWWAFQGLAIITGNLPNAVVAIGANAVILNISSMVFMFYLGLSISCNVRVGNALGANDVERAKMAAKMTLGMATTMAVLCATFLFLTREQLPFLLTHDADINALVTRILVISAAFQIPDSINATVQGIFRGCGRQSLGACLNFVAYYLLGIPLGCLLAFQLGWGVEGLWVGITFGLLVIAIVGTTLISKSDWESLAKQAGERFKNRSSHGRGNGETMGNE